MKRRFGIGVVVVAAIGLTGCSTATGGEESGSGETLSFMTNVVGDQSKVLEEVLKDFTAETGIKVQYSAPGESYEELMKTQMSANELPDLFTTHGWSVLRYSEYLEPVNDRPFFSRIKEQIKPVISDDNDNVYVLPIDADIAGIVYNVDVIEAAGVDIDTIKTWDDFTAAAIKVKESGVIPIHVGGKDVWTVGQFGDWIAPSFFVTDESSNQRKALKDGKFDAATWEKVSGLMSTWAENELFNVDALTADYLADAAAIGSGKAAFGFYGNSFIVDARTTNPDAKLAMMPIPAASPSDEPTLIGGERIAVGVWKDSPKKDDAWKLLEFLAKDENVAKISSASGNSPGIEGVTSDIGDIQEYLDKYEDTRLFPYFDREYLPSGMWDVMCATGTDIISKKPDAVKNAGEVMKQNFDDKF